MNTLRYGLLVTLFLGLAALEITHGLLRLGDLRESRARELEERVRLDHAELARVVSEHLARGRRHAEYLALVPSARRALDGTGDWRDLQAELLPYLVTFTGVDRIRIVDESMKERFRCERIGQGVGALPAGLLADGLEPSVAELIDRARQGAVATSRLVVDASRVEVAERDRRVLHYAVTVTESDVVRGWVVLTTYAAPILERVRDFRPVEGVRAYLLENGMPLDGAAAAAGGDDVGTHRAKVAADPDWTLVAETSPAARDAAVSDLGTDAVWIIGSTTLSTLILALVAMFFVRLTAREYRVREAERRLEEARRREEMERRLQTADRLSSIGLLTAGVAHEINNPLEGIGNYLSLLDREGVTEEKRTRYLAQVRHGFERIGAIVRDLLGFARPGVSPEVIDLRDVVNRAHALVRYAKEFRGVSFDLTGLDTPIPVEGDAGRLEQVILNLFLNAGHAMKGEGTVVVIARFDGDEVEVVVEDDGPGISPSDLEHIFDPFFTRSGGTGLGLAVSYGTVRAHGGALTAANRPDGGGARITLRLPRAGAVPATTLPGEGRS